MFMVASSVVLTVVVLNYHHRTADIHEMPQWVSVAQKAAIKVFDFFKTCTSLTFIYSTNKLMSSFSFFLNELWSTISAK
jgi:Neurotransmitter-gated ion-channel transmembrane region.